MSKMKAISLWQPWASLVVHGVKKIETRDWQPPRSLIGKRIAIHAAKLDRYDPLMLAPPFLGLLEEDELPHGAIVGTVKLSSCIRMTPTNIADFQERRPLEVQLGDWQPGRYAWVLKQPRICREPIMWRGSQGFFPVDLEALRSVGTIPV
jgi:hypothetical protein